MDEASPQSDVDSAGDRPQEAEEVAAVVVTPVAEVGAEHAATSMPVEVSVQNNIAYGNATDCCCLLICAFVQLVTMFSRCAHKLAQPSKAASIVMS